MQNKPRYLKDATLFFKNELKPFYEAGELQSILRIFWEDVFAYSSHELILHEDKILNNSEWQQIQQAVDLLKKHTPIQHITGFTWFYGLKIQVNSDVLIPRPETEEILNIANQDNTINFSHILDIGTGSGCIALALKKDYPHANVTAIDISEKAIDTAKENALLNNLDVQFLKEDILNRGNNFKQQKYDLICSNPPYIPFKEKSSMSENVIDFEPGQALFVPDNDPLLFYKTIARIGTQQLITNGLILCEINEFLANETAKLFEHEGYHSVEIHQDLFNKPRVVAAKL